MRKTIIILCLFPLILIYSQIPDYKRDADPWIDLKNAKERALKENKRILMIVGGEWCEWCLKLDKFLKNDRELLDIIEKNYIVIKIYSLQTLEPNQTFLIKLPLPKGFPFIYVLEKDGELLAAQETSSFESGNNYNKNKIKNFLLFWKLKK